MCISQQKYIKELLKRFDMEESKGNHWISTLPYWQQANIVFSVGVCERFQSNPKESHLKAAKRILRYLKGTQNLVLYYPSNDDFNLIGYADADYAGYVVDRKNTSGMTHFLG
ncbi:secreted RxLR effector protein 161-like [Nicotiana sylvestris]|uniref:secreted RxLR effector protein 161-like n=1 Tax=Nicotiana sylvestris TaxID=4096 RepID=UPI00388CAB56